MGAHGRSVAASVQPGVAFDVAFRSRFPGRANTADARVSSWITVPELPWPLRFDFVRGQESDGSIRWVCAGLELGAPIPRSDARDTDEYELTMQRMAILLENFSRYQQMAEDLLIPAPWNVELAAQKRAAMGRRRRQRLTDDYLAGLVREWRAGGELQDLAASRGMHRTTLRHQLEEAERRGMIPEGIPRRAD